MEIHSNPPILYYGFNIILTTLGYQQYLELALGWPDLATTVYWCSYDSDIMYKLTEFK